MNRRTVLIASLIAGLSPVFGVHAAPPEGKGQGKNAGSSDKDSSSKHGEHGSNGGYQGNSAGRSGYDSHGRNYAYFDDRRDASGHHRGGDAVTGLVYAGITATLAHGYALDYGLTGYSSLPPGIRKNLARGKPLPPGIQKKMVPGPLLGRLPKYPGYEWRVAGSDLVLIAVATAVVADILYDVFD